MAAEGEYPLTPDDGVIVVMRMLGNTVEALKREIVVRDNQIAALLAELDTREKAAPPPRRARPKGDRTAADGAT